MRHSKLTLIAAAIALCFVMTTGQAAKEGKKKEKTTKCPVAGKEIKISEAKVVAYKDAKIYVCCGNCKAKLEKDATPFAAKLNHQLAQTKQAKQVKCPLAGRPVNPEESVQVAGVKVGVCCGNCKAKLAKAEGAEQIELAFSDAAFAKGFKIGKAKKKKAQKKAEK